MIEIKPSKEFVEKCLKLADELLEDAKLMLASIRLRSAVDRTYYAMFHAAEAILAAKGFKPKTHKGLKTLFGKHIVEQGLVSRDLGRRLSDAFDMRQAGTYDIYASFGTEAVRNLMEDAEEFVNKIKELIEAGVEN